YDAIDEIGTVVAQEAIDCGFAKEGWLAVATTIPQRERLVRDVEARRTAGLARDEDHVLLSAAEAARHARVGGCLAAAYSPHGARVDPARLVRGLARACERHGVVIHEGTPALEAGPGAVRTPAG